MLRKWRLRPRSGCPGTIAKPWNGPFPSPIPRRVGMSRSSSAKPAMSHLANPSPLASSSSKATAREIGPSQENRLDFPARGQIQPIGARGINPFSAHIFPILAPCQAHREGKNGRRSWRSALDPRCCRRRRSEPKIRGNSAEEVLLWPRTNSSYSNEPIMFRRAVRLFV